MRRRSSLILAFLLAACGGGGGSDGGSGDAGVSQGPITGIGSFHVSGRQWTLGSGGQVILDGVLGSENDLTLGMVVTVDGELSSDGLTGTATRVVSDDEIEGPIDSLVPDVDETAFSVFGRTFVADRSTVYDGVTTFDSFQALAAGTVVEVSGLPDFHATLGDITRATRIEVKSATVTTGVTVVKIRGTADNFNIVDNTVEIGSVLVRLNAAPCGAPLLDPITLDLTSPALVMVKGRYLAMNDICADRVAQDDGLPDAGNVELEGFVTSASSNSSFAVGDVAVNGSSATFEPSDLVVEVGMKLEVEGSLTGGVLAAREVQQRGSARIRAEVSDTGTGSFVVLGKTISTNAGTEFDPGLPAIGNFVEVRAVEDGAGGLTAIHVKMETPDNVELRGRVESVDRPNRTLTILGIAIGTASGAGGTEYFAQGGAPLTVDQFFDDIATRVEIGNVVEARDCTVPPYLAFDDPACELEFED